MLFMTLFFFFSFYPQASDLMSHCTSIHTNAGLTGSDYISQNSTQECTVHKIISNSGRTTEVAVPHVKQEDPEVEMAGGEEETEEQDTEESVKLEHSSEWDGTFEYNHAGKWTTSLIVYLTVLPIHQFYIRFEYNHAGTCKWPAFMLPVA